MYKVYSLLMAVALTGLACAFIKPLLPYLPLTIIAECLIILVFIWHDTRPVVRESENTYTIVSRTGKKNYEILSHDDN